MAAGQLTELQRRQWRDTILASPHLFVGQEKVDFATFPAFETDFIEPRQSLMSIYLTGKDDSYVAMPGAFTRVYRITSYNVCYTKLLRKHCSIHVMHI